MLQELHIPLAPDQEHKNIFLDIPIVRFRNGKNLNNHLVRAKLQNVEITGMSKSCGKRNCRVCDFLPKPVVKVKVGYSSVTLRMLFTL